MQEACSGPICDMLAAVAVHTRRLACPATVCAACSAHSASEDGAGTSSVGVQKFGLRLTRLQLHVQLQSIVCGRNNDARDSLVQKIGARDRPPDQIRNSKLCALSCLRTLHCSDTLPLVSKGYLWGVPQVHKTIAF